MTDKLRILVLGIYLTDKPSLIESLRKSFLGKTIHEVTLAFAAIGNSSAPEELKDITLLHVNNFKPKFEILNILLSHFNIHDFDYIIITDDDISLPNDFIDDYIYQIKRHSLSLAQPARTHDSYIDHRFVERLDGITARRTNFVEIGPLFSIARSLYNKLLPFDETPYMGWGLDFVWPTIVNSAREKMGIVDATPVNHSFRRPTENYEYKKTLESMQKYLASTPHLTKSEAFVILESYV